MHEIYNNLKVKRSFVDAKKFTELDNEIAQEYRKSRKTLWIMSICMVVGISLYSFFLGGVSFGLIVLIPLLGAVGIVVLICRGVLPEGIEETFIVTEGQIDLYTAHTQYGNEISTTFQGHKVHKDYTNSGSSFKQGETVCAVVALVKPSSKGVMKNGGVLLLEILDGDDAL